MGEVLNLRMARKRAERRKREQSAAENRERFGQTKAEKVARKAAQERERASLEAHRRESVGEAE